MSLTTPPWMGCPIHLIYPPGWTKTEWSKGCPYESHYSALDGMSHPSHLSTWVDKDRVEQRFLSKELQNDRRVQALNHINWTEWSTIYGVIGQVIPNWPGVYCEDEYEHDNTLGGGGGGVLCIFLGGSVQWGF